MSHNQATLHIQVDAPIGTISPRLYGHFAEHLGRCCYGGLWVGPETTDVPQQHGFRSDVIAALKALPVPLLRWPGGCYADHYHWRDGIGPSEQRPVRLGMSCDIQVEDRNQLGTHEFLWLCRTLGAEPYLAGNVGSGSPQELCDWVEYCNTRVPTTLGRLRAANGAPEPFGVRLWGVGNENWGCGGHYDAVGYAWEYRRYATMLRHVDPSIELVACGYDDHWNAQLLQAIAPHFHLVDHVSIHAYWINGGSETNFSEEEYYGLLTEAAATEDLICRTAALISDAIGAQRRIGIALDEWGVWHPEARHWGPGEAPRRSPLTYEQANTLRDAIAAAIALEGFHRRCNVLTLANLAQVVNVLQAPIMTDGSHMCRTPTYYLLHLHKPHIGATALAVDITQGESIPGGAPAISATASRTKDSIAITLLNRHARKAAEVTLICDHALEPSEGQILTADRSNAQNLPGYPEEVTPTALVAHRDGPQRWRIDLPPHAIASLVFKAAR